MVARNALLNLAGHAAPLVAALLLVPPLVQRLEAERFGFLALAWALVGYLSLLDLGLGRALTRLVAASHSDLRELARTALSLTLLLGALAGAGLYFASPVLADDVLGVPADLQVEARDALHVLACYLPIVTLSAALRGILEGRERFGLVNAIRAPLGILTFAAPLAASAWSTSLVALVAALALPRLAAAAAFWAACRSSDPALTAFGWPRRDAARRLLAYGGWLTVSNVVGPLMVYLDRFVIGAALTIAAVAYYSAPYEVVTRLWLVPAAVSGVLFPAMVAASPERLASLYRGGVKAVLAIVFLPALAIILFAAEGLRAWLGDAFAAEGTRVAQLLGLGVAVNCLAYLPFTVLQARGQAALTAKIHAVELPIYLAVLFAAVSQWGIDGAALAWALRCAGDALVLCVLARTANCRAWGFSGAQVWLMAAALATLAGALLPFSFAAKAVYFCTVLLLFCGAGWLVLLDGAERALARHPLAFFRGQPPR